MKTIDKINKFGEGYQLSAISFCFLLIYCAFISIAIYFSAWLWGSHAHVLPLIHTPRGAPLYHRVKRCATV